MPQPTRRSPKRSVEAPTPSSDDDRSIVVVDPFTMQSRRRSLSSLLDGTTHDTPEAEEAYLQEILAGATHLRPVVLDRSTPLGRAQAMMYEAAGLEDAAARVAMAREALKVSPDCADAWVLLAEETAGDDEVAVLMYEAGVEAGERALGGEAAFTDHTGDFWENLNARPYMRSRQGLAMTLWEMGELEEAMQHYREMLDLNPTDDQRNRYLLVTALMEQGDDREVGSLLRRYGDDPSTIWAYSWALWHFRKDGAHRRTNGSLRKALDINPWVPDYLLGTFSLPRVLPEPITPGSDEEAIVYVWSALAGWLRTPGAIDWLRDRQAR